MRGETMDHTFPVTGPIRVDARLRHCDLHLEAVPGLETVTVEFEGHLGDLAERIVVQLGGDALLIDVPSSGPFGMFGGAAAVRIQVRVPAGSSLEASAGSGDIVATGPLTHARAESGSGDVRCAVVGSGQLTSGSGDVRVDDADGAVVARTGSGSIHLGRGSGLDATTGSGAITMLDASGECAARSGSGSVRVQRMGPGRLRAKSASGSVRVGVAAGLPALLDLHSVSGRVHTALEAAGEPAPGDPYVELSLSTVSGSVEVARA